jgi:hypothetical protein
MLQIGLSSSTPFSSFGHLRLSENPAAKSDMFAFSDTADVHATSFDIYLEKRIDENLIRICAHLSTIWELESSIVQPFWFVSLVNSTHAFVYNTLGIYPESCATVVSCCRAGFILVSYYIRARYRMICIRHGQTVYCSS